MNGVINLFKPKGWTSRDAVNKVRNLLKVGSAGHMGTLDPQGEGVLVIGLGKGTRLFDALLTKDKVYEAEFAFGYETDTLDGDGVVVGRTDLLPSEAEIKSALPGFIGNVKQLPPAYSAKNVGGVRAYELARKGVDFTLEPSEVEIYSIEALCRTAPAVYKFRIHCSAGTYIRSICRDLAYSLSSLATMTSIVRTRAGRFCISDSTSLEDVAAKGNKLIVSLSEALDDFPRLDVPESEYTRLTNGVKIPLLNAPESPFTVFCKGELFGLGEKTEDDRLKIKTYLRD